MLPTTLVAIVFLLLLAPGFISGSIIEWLAPVRVRETAMKEKITTSLALSIWNFLLYLGLSNWSVLGISPLVFDLKADDVGLPVDLKLQLYNIDAGSLAWILVISIAIGVFAAWTLNNGWLFRLLNYTHISYSTGRASIWFDTLQETQNKWAKVYLKDGTVILGYISHYSNDPTSPMLFLSRVHQNVDGHEKDELVNILSAKSDNSIDVEGPGVLLLSAKIKRIEFWD